MATTITSKNAQKWEDNVALHNSGPSNNNLWNAWNERVEAVRELRFSWDGTIIENDFGHVSKIGKTGKVFQYNLLLPTYIFNFCFSIITITILCLFC